MAAIMLDGLVNTATPEGVSQQVHTIYGEDSKVGVTTTFLKQFPQLRYFDGEVTLASADDLEGLVSKWDLGSSLTLIIEHPEMISIQRLGDWLAQVIPASHTRISLPVWPGITLDGSSCHLAPGAYEASTIQLLGQLPCISQLSQLADMGYLSKLPSTIKVVEPRAGSEWWRARPAWPLEVRGPALSAPPEGYLLHPNWVGVDLAISLTQVIQLLAADPRGHIKTVGIWPASVTEIDRFYKTFLVVSKKVSQVRLHTNDPEVQRVGLKLLI